MWIDVYRTSVPYPMHDLDHRLLADVDRVVVDGDPAPTVAINWGLDDSPARAVGVHRAGETQGGAA